MQSQSEQSKTFLQLNKFFFKVVLHKFDFH